MKINPPYKHLVQKPNLCGDTCLQMIFFRRGIWVEQEQLAKDLGTRVIRPELYRLNLERAKNEKELGTDLKEFEGEKIKSLCKKYHISIKTKIYYMEEIKNIKEFITENLAKGNDILVNYPDILFDKQAIHNEGHYSLISAIEGNIVTLCDPWYLNKSFWQIEFEKLAKGMDTRDGMGAKRGLVLFSS